ncbi:MAG: small multi-drug export protein [Oscillospiraceae bacterium]|nr:small multi-drug export protein [Oscillospiraceae bacterium]
MTPEFIIFIISMMPVLELRGGMIAAGLLSVNWKTAMLICILGNIVPIPFILLFVKKVFELFKKTRFSKFIYKFEQKISNKSKGIFKHKKIGLFLFVAIPLPGTGAWTGSIIAALLGFKMKNAVISIFFGVVVAAIIMSILSYGILGFFV